MLNRDLDSVSIICKVVHRDLEQSGLLLMLPHLVSQQQMENEQEWLIQ